MLLSEKQMQDYQSNGYLAGITISDRDEVETFHHHFDVLEAQEGQEKCQVFQQCNTKPAKLYPSRLNYTATYCIGVIFYFLAQELLDKLAL